MIRINARGDFKRTDKFFNRLLNFLKVQRLKYYAEQGVKVLSEATPKDTGLTAASWSYEIEKTPTGLNIRWLNSNIQGGVNIAVILQYGHGTRNGGYVQGRDYINPALRPIFDKMAKDAWEEVDNIK